MTEIYFENIENVIINQIMLARKSIKIAVAWFNLKTILDILTLKLRGGISVEIILQYDEINNGGKYSLDFTDFKSHGGVLIWAHSSNATMHQKFCVIDEDTVISGSFNWTNRAENRNDEDIQVHKNDDQLILNYMSRFDELKAKYAGTSSSLNTKARTNQQKIRQKSIQERVRAFVSLLNECDLSAYDLEYIKTFKDYWTEEVKPNKLRFETKVDFIMLIELDSWSNLNVQIADEKEYNRFLAEANEKAHKEYQRYLGSLNTNNDDLEFSTDNDLKYLETEFYKNIEQYKTTFLKDLGLINLKSSVYTFIKNNHLPAVVSYCKQDYIYVLPFPEINKTIWKDKKYNGRGLETIKLIEHHFNTKLLIDRPVEPIPEIMSEDAFVYRYVRMQLLNSKYKERCKSDSSSSTKEKFKLLFEAYHAIYKYKIDAKKIINEYGNIKLIDLYKNHGENIEDIYRKQNKKLPDNVDDIKVKNCISIDGGYKIQICDQYNKSIRIFYDYAPIGKYNSLHDDIIFRAFGFHIEHIKGATGCACYKLEIPDDLLCAYDNGKFLSLKEMEELMDCKNAQQSLQSYHDELYSWDCYG